MSSNLRASGPLLGALLGGLLAAGACAQRSSYQLPAQSPAAATAGTTDSGNRLPSPPPPSRRGVILPGDPSSGTGQLGAGAGEAQTRTGTSGTRVTPGSSDGAK
ncbi:MAG TPA: hypothetical protein VFH68_01295 [Polyangia bacterium]|nr:hypothetical protein [Polyangia bacterium]